MTTTVWKVKILLVLSTLCQAELREDNSDIGSRWTKSLDLKTNEETDENNIINPDGRGRHKNAREKFFFNEIKP